MRPRYLLGKLYNVFKIQRQILSYCRDNCKGAVKILIYHDIPASRLEQFNDHIKALYNSYPFLTPNQFHAFMNGDYCMEGLHLLITFDDGFLSSKIAAMEILEPLKIKSFFFVTANFIGLTNEALWRRFVSQKIYDGLKHENEIGHEYAPMDWKDIIWLKNHGHTIGSHTLNHVRLSRLPTVDALASEIIGSGDILEKRLDMTINDFAYPFGDIGSISPEALALIQKRYKYCFSGLRGLNRPSTHPMSIFRDAINLGDTVDYLKLQAEDGLSLLYRKQSKKLRSMIKDDL